MILPLPTPIDQSDIEITIIPQGTTIDQPIAAMSLEDYQRLVEDRAEVLRWVREAIFQLQYYREDTTE